MKQRLKDRARQNGRSLEAEVREILDTAAQEDAAGGKRQGFGTEMASYFKDAKLTKKDWEQFQAGIKELRRGSRVRAAKLGK